MGNPKFTRLWFCKQGLQPWREHLLPRGQVSRYLEIGVWEGASMHWAVENLLLPGGLAIGLDNWAPHTGYKNAVARNVDQYKKRLAAAKKMAFSNLSPWMSGNPGTVVELRETDSFSGLVKLLHKGSEWVGTTDIAYVDGNHYADYALPDMILCWTLLRAGGVLVVDDLHQNSIRRGKHRDNAPKVAEAAAAFESCFRPEQLYRTKKQVAWIRY